MCVPWVVLHFHPTPGKTTHGNLFSSCVFRKENIVEGLKAERVIIDIRT